MRISDWSSDVCSSDLDHDDQQHADDAAGGVSPAAAVRPGGYRADQDEDQDDQQNRADGHGVPPVNRGPAGAARASSGITRPPIGRSLYRQHHLRSEEHTSELQSLMRISYAVFCLKKKKKTKK